MNKAREYTKAIVGGLGYAIALATALGLTHYRWIGIIVGVLGTAGIAAARNIPAAPPASAPPKPPLPPL